MVMSLSCKSPSSFSKDLSKECRVDMFCFSLKFKAVEFHGLAVSCTVQGSTK